MSGGHSLAYSHVQPGSKMHRFICSYVANTAYYYLRANAVPDSALRTVGLTWGVFELREDEVITMRNTIRKRNRRSVEMSEKCPTRSKESYRYQLYHLQRSPLGSSDSNSRTILPYTIPVPHLKSIHPCNSGSVEIVCLRSCHTFHRLRV